MADYESYTCPNCGDTFHAHPSANAADGYCSPQCESIGKNLA